MKNRDYEQFFRCFDRIMNKRMQMDNRKRTYGLPIELSCKEIHIIDEIGRNPSIGVKGIAVNKGVTEGAVSQLVKKLIEKGLIKKQVSEESEAKVSLTLTEDGQTCFLGHIEFHKEADKKWYSLLDEMENEDYLRMQYILQKMDSIMEEE